MQETFRADFPKQESDQEGAQKRPDIIDVSADKKEKKVEADPFVRQDKVFRKIMLQFGDTILNSKEKIFTIPANLKS